MNDRAPDYKDREEILIRTLHPDEWEAYKKLRLEALQTEPQAFATLYADALQTPDASWRERLERVETTQESWMLFADSGGTLVGMVAAYTREPGVVEIVSVYVTASMRGRGISRLLMEAILGEIVANASVRRLTLTVNKSQTIAVALYRSLGFQVTEEVVVPLGDGSLRCEYVMEKAAFGMPAKN